MTTNAGARELLHGAIGFQREIGVGAGESQAVKDTFSPEFRNRLDAIISFKPLSEDIILKVVDKFIADLGRRLAKQRVALAVSDEARRYFARTGYDPAYGARPLNRVIQDKLKKRLADELLFGKLSGGGEVTVDLDGDELVFNYQK
jgi:ATP-dependent Clp protease ATP-binding subunit ClpA